MIHLRQYQQECLLALRNAYRAGARAPLLVAPTGSGKTVLFCEVVRGRIAKGGRPMIIAHRSELIDQIDRTLREFGIVPGIIAGDYPESPHAPVQIASVFTLVKRLERTPAPDLIVVDEAHHAIRKTTWGRILTHYEKAWLLGVTATPTRLSGEGLNDLFDHMILGPSVRELQAIGALCPVSLYAPPGPDLSNVPIRMGDYAQSALAEVMSGGTVLGDAVAHYRRHAHQLPAVAFCVSVEHAAKVAQKFRDGGYTSASLDGSLKQHFRRQIVDDFRTGRVQVLTSCDLIAEGFDLPRLTVGILLRGTQSTGLYLQWCGRCLRPFEGKTRAVILDHAGNTLRHGLPTDDREWSLESVPVADRRGRNERVPGVRVCNRCFAASPAGRPTCVNCGFLFEVDRPHREIEGELEEVTESNKRDQTKRTPNAARDLAGLIQLGRMRGYRQPEAWARHVWSARQRKLAEKMRGVRHGETES
jgi:DNA repair protein RadD